MTKRRYLFFLIPCILLLGIILWRVTAHRHHWDLANLEMETTGWNLESISREDALTLDRELSAADQKNLPQNLELLEADALAETGEPVAYYQFTGNFSFPGEADVEGTVTSLVLVAQTDKPYFYAIRQPLSNVVCKHGDVIWTQMSSHSDIPMWNPQSARIDVLGYLSVPTGNPEAPEELSKTLHPTYTVMLE